jgi:hypothetical protein
MKEERIKGEGARKKTKKKQKGSGDEKNKKISKTRGLKN